jgi:hypothetical protein
MFDDPRRDAPEKIIITNVSHDRAASQGRPDHSLVTEIRGDFVKCGPRTQAAGRDRLERWVTLKYVVQITKNES